MTTYTPAIQNLQYETTHKTAAYKTAVKKIHSEDISNWVDNTYSKLTGTRAPLISKGSYIAALEEL